MDITDIVPINPVAEMFDIPEEIRWLMFFAIFILGYISFMYFEKAHVIKKKLNSIDILFLITIFGSLIMLKSFFIFFFSLGILIVPFSGTVDLIGIVFGLPFFILIIILCIALYLIDIKSIRNIQRKFSKNQKYGWLVLSLFFTFIFILSTYSLWHYSPNFARFTYIIITISCFLTLNPTIYYFLSWYKNFLR